MKRALTLLLILCLLLAAAPAALAEGDGAEAVLERMTVSEKIEQLIMPAFRYTADSYGNTVGVTEINGDIEDMLCRHGFAGVIFFAQSLTETEASVRLVDAMQRANASVPGRPQLLTSVDQEGGIVTRLGQGSVTCGNMALGALGDTEATGRIASVLGSEIMAVGLNVDFAPVLDLNSNPANPVIGVRSFSDDPEIAASQGVAFLKGLSETGAIGALKHFPGHGDTSADSHTGLPRVDKDLDELRQYELVPFKACIDAGAEMIMTAHIQFPAIEKRTYTSISTGEEITLPATLSPAIVTDLLRGELGFDGVVVTDALEMDAIREHFGLLDTVRLAIEAGVDILLLPIDLTSRSRMERLESLIDDAAELAENGGISMKKLDAAVLRVLRLKERHGLLERYDGSDLNARLARAASTVGSTFHHETEWEISKRAVTMVKNDGVLPLTDPDESAVVMVPYDSEVLGMEYAIRRLKDEGKLPEGTDVPVYSYQYRSAGDMAWLASGADHVIAVSETYSPSGLYSGDIRLLNAVIASVHRGGGDVTIISSNLPYDAARLTEADAHLLCWSDRSMSEDPRVSDGAVSQYGPNLPAALYVIFSGESPEGKLPVNIPALDEDYDFSDEILYPRGFGLIYEEPECPFVDVAESAYYYGPVLWAVMNGITSGTSESTFSPDGAATRDQVVTFLWRAAGAPENSGGGRFSDVPPDAYYAGAVSWAVERGITRGTSDTTFAPERTCTRGEFVTFLHRCAGSPVPQGAKIPFTDVADGAYYRNAVGWAVEHGVTNGTGAETFSPDGKCTRGQIVTFLYRYYG